MAISQETLEQARETIEKIFERYEDIKHLNYNHEIFKKTKDDYKDEQ